jgi:hypothetical protein
MTQEVNITNQTEEEILDDQEDDGMKMFEIEQANKRLP